LTLSLNQLISIEKALYLATKRAYDPEGYGLQFVLKNFIQSEQKEIKEVDEAKARLEAKSTASATDKLNVRFGGQDAKVQNA